MNNQRTKATRDGPSYWGFIGFGCIVIMLVVLVGYAVICWIPSSWKVEPGGAYEGLSALFSGLAFIGILYALKYQRAELKLQRDELALTRQEMVSQRHEMETQNATLAHQRFENSFFQLLRFQRESMQMLRVTIGSDSTFGFEGGAAFHNAVHFLVDHFRLIMGPPLEGEQLLKYINHTFQQSSASDNADFGHYFRTLYHLIEFVDKSPIEDRAYYIGLVRAQLSTNEVALLFYKGLSEQGKEFKPLIEKYALLKDWRMHQAFEAHAGLYTPDAYGN